MKQVDMVREFMRVFGQETPEKQKLPDESTMALRVRLTSEENAEMATSITTARYFDAVLDRLYVAFGDAVAAGVHRRGSATRIWESSQQQHVEALDRG